MSDTMAGNEKDAVAPKTDQPVVERRETVQLGQIETSRDVSIQERRTRTNSEISMSQTSLRSFQEQPIERTTQAASSTGEPTGNTNTGPSNQEKQTTQRKRSRTGEVSNQIGEGHVKRVDDILQQMQMLIDQVVKRGDKGKSILDKINLGDLMRELSMNFVSCLAQSNHYAAKVITHYEEKAAMANKLQNYSDEVNNLQQQIISLQQQLSKQGATESAKAPASYLQAATRNIINKQQLPINVIPDSVKMSPSEKILIFRAKEKGVLPTKEQTEDFRKEIRKALGEELIKQVVVIRQTKYGGHTIIFQTAASRDVALAIFRVNEDKAGIDERNSCIVAPKRKLAKVVCRQPPDDYTPQQFLCDFYGSHNMFLNEIPLEQREATIIPSSALGWIFELSSEEAAACFAQGGKIRFGYARELKVEEFIPLQQCYKCCMFGHNAIDCFSETEYCRLCGEVGHAGKDCSKKNDKKSWRCINCKITNETKGYRLPIDHAAAQLHKCPCAQNQKMVKKEQLAAAGIFTTPIHSETVYRKQERQPNTIKGPITHGTQQQNSEQKKTQRGKSRSKSQKRQTGRIDRFSSASSASSAVHMRDFNISSTSSTAPSNLTVRDINFSSVITNGSGTSAPNGPPRQTQRNQRPQSTEGWKFVGRTRLSEESDSRGRRSEDKIGGTNSTSSLMRPSQNDDTHMRI